MRALCIWIFIACASLPAQQAIQEIHLRATVEAVAPVGSFSGTITRVGRDPRFALTIRIETAVPEVAQFRRGARVTLGIHSPTLLFDGQPVNGKTYQFVLRRSLEDGKVKFSGLEVRSLR